MYKEGSRTGRHRGAGIGCLCGSWIRWSEQDSQTNVGQVERKLNLQGKDGDISSKIRGVPWLKLRRPAQSDISCVLQLHRVTSSMESSLLLSPTAFTVRLAISPLIGIFDGLERAWTHKELGMKTFAIISLLGMLAPLLATPFALASIAGGFLAGYLHYINLHGCGIHPRHTRRLRVDGHSAAWCYGCADLPVCRANPRPRKAPGPRRLSLVQSNDNDSVKSLTY